MEKKLQNMECRKFEKKFTELRGNSVVVQNNQENLAEKLAKIEEKMRETQKKIENEKKIK